MTQEDNKREKNSEARDREQVNHNSETKGSGQASGDETKETSVNEFSQAPESDNAKKVTKSVYEEGAKRKENDPVGPEKRLEDHPGAYQIKEKSVDEEEDSQEE